MFRPDAAASPLQQKVMAYSTSTLAEGCFGKVYKQKYNDTWAAIKKVPQHLISKKDLERECAVYNKATHPNIVKLLGNITLKDAKWVIPLEFIFGEDLETTIFKASKSKIQLTPSIKGSIIVGMCEGLLHLHSRDIVHQDLKPENIMVEHNTNRAVIIDLGLAKFFRFGLNSAIDMGNEAYSAPEVLQRGSQRDQRSDVWAMGKIIAELWARVRLYTPSVCPAKIKEILQDQGQPYCHAVCRMVDPDPSLRASVGGVMSEIRRAAGAGNVTNTPVQKEHLKPPTPQINVRNPSPSPANRDPSPMNRAHSPANRDPSPMNRAHSPANRDPSPMNRARSPFNRDPSPMNRAHSPFNRDPSPMNRAPSPFNRDPSPMNRRDPAPFKRDPSPFNRDPLTHNKSPSPLSWERSPKPEFKTLHPQAAMHVSPFPRSTEDKNKNQALVPTGGSELTRDFMKMQLYQEAAKDLPCKLPTTGRVVVRRFEEKNGEVGTWEQKEVVTRDGKIVKFDDIKFNSS
ncbi:glycogen synthase kinase-3 isoform X1 [Sebastes umbrosus]|uniref:glycogen synthase kinase-3 isoform X1 n=2 Tax=Sebastes umbrosus TaxID=72105 RepID=UPI00189D947B|nr:glycogen synthase kinase-3 isoform X1 [Sebastes umbrosus]